MQDKNIHDNSTIDTLVEVRESINLIDQQMVHLLEQRLDLVNQVNQYKVANQLPIFDAGREQAVYENIRSAIQNKDYSEVIEECFNDLMKVSRTYQLKKRGK